MMRHPRLRPFIAALLLSIPVATPAAAQFALQPAIGLQTLWFNGDYPIRQPISPGIARDLPLGGGVIGNTNGLQVQLELIPNPEGIIRIPLSAGAYFLGGKTTFSTTRITDPDPRRLTFNHQAQIYQAAAGLTASFFKAPSLYFSAQGTLNYIPTTSLTTRVYFAETNETISETTVHPSDKAETRYGAYLRVGTQLDFFDPMLLDVSLGYGALNLGGKPSNVEEQRNLIVVDNRNSPEVTVGYIGINMSLVWRP